MPRSKSGVRMMLISVHIPRRMLEGLDELAKSGLFPSRSEAIRVAVRDLLIKERGRKGSGVRREARTVVSERA
ncbi:MAG: CopG family transcriptional regulator [Caldivirga sp. MG_3]|jgi:transcriptional regulator, CopG family|nr:MAG: CopG family transcriptional regulator [Caldivirga sp. MG_3]